MQSGRLVVLGYAKRRRGAGLAGPSGLGLGLRVRLGPVGPGAG